MVGLFVRPVRLLCALATTLPMALKMGLFTEFVSYYYKITQDNGLYRACRWVRSADNAGHVGQAFAVSVGAFTGAGAGRGPGNLTSRENSRRPSRES
jgi:hypothetical protein